MDGGRGFGGSDFMSLLDHSNHSLWIPSSSRSFQHETMVKFDQEGQRVRLSPTVERHRGSDGEEEFEVSNLFSQPEKKRRLTAEQVQFLEKNFEKENKLEPERKVELAKQLGLQPRQVAIWFQNRRARFKSKQLEKEYDSLKANYDQLKLDFDSLLKERENLHNQVKLLTKKLKQRETGQSEMDTDIPGNNALYSERKPEWEPEKLPKMGAPSNGKQTEDAISAKSDVLDSESPHCTEEGNHLEDPVDSTHMLDPDLMSDFSQDEEDPQLMSLLPPTAAYHNLLKVDQDQDQGCYDLNGTTCNFSLVDDQPIWPWLY